MSDIAVDSAPTMMLPPVLDLPAAAGLKTELLAALAKGEGLCVDAGAVERVTSPYLQVLVAGANAFAQSGGPSLRIIDASPAFRETVEGLALGHVLPIGGENQ